MKLPLNSSLNAPERLAALAKAALPELTAVPTLDRLSQLVACWLGAPAALVTLVEPECERLIGRYGLAALPAATRHVPRTSLFGTQVVHSAEPLVISDVKAFRPLSGTKSNAMLTIGAYLGVPLWSDGQVIGSLCAIDHVSRVWHQEHVAWLAMMASVVRRVLADGVPIAERPEPPTKIRGAILVVDDEFHTARLAARALNASGYTVYRADDGLDGLSIILSSPPELRLALLDMYMPGMNGDMLAHMMAKMHPNLPIILTSAADLGWLHSSPAAPPVTAVLAKPFLHDELRALVARILE